MDLEARLTLTAYIYAAVILGGCMSILVAQRLPRIIRRLWERWRGGDTP